MKTLSLILCAAVLALTLCACGETSQAPKPDADTPATTTAEAATTTTTAAPVAADVGAWNWADGELDCYGYTTHGNACYLSFRYPDNFTAKESNDSGEQYRGFWFNPANEAATPNESPYGIYIYFLQGGYGARRAGLEEDIDGGFAERELGGRTVLFGEMAPDPNTGSHTFTYYVPYDEDEYARIWFLVSDPEADGAFRRTFEQSLKFVKE